MERILVLNADYTPLNTTTFKKGFKLVYKGKAEVIKAGGKIATSIKEYVKPLIIRLLHYVRFKFRQLKVNRKRIYERDHNQCGYCGTTRDLTIDHIIPKSKGGSNDWNNLVTCCYKCNLKKADRTPQEAHMVLLTKPYQPTVFDKMFDGTIEAVWKEYQMSFGVS